MKGIVDYKHPKKMKKRRQLDALVDTVKLPRSRKNSASAQELLDCHSDSSEVDELTLSQSTSKRKSRCCICQSIAARIGLFMVTMACLTTCIAIIWVQWHLRQELESLRKQITSVQNYETVPPSILKIQSQLAEMNKSVTTIKNGPHGVQEITNTIMAIKSKLKDLHEANMQLQKSVSAAEEVLGLPSKMNTLSSMIATLGSDFKDFMNMQTSKYTEIEKRLSALETETKEATRNPNNSLDNHLNQISQELVNYNISLNTGLQSVNGEMERQSVRISTLEEFTKSISLSSGSKLNRTEVTDIVTKLLQEKVSDKLLVLRSELDSLSGRLDSHNSALINITATINSFKNKEDQAVVRSEVTTAPFTPADITDSKSQSGDKLMEKRDKITPVIHIEGINTFEDLVKVFNESLPLKDGQLDIETLNDLMNTTVNAEKLRPFDTDRNGLYSEAEMSEALGFHENRRSLK